MLGNIGYVKDRISDKRTPWFKEHIKLGWLKSLNCLNYFITNIENKKNKIYIDPPEIALKSTVNFPSSEYILQHFKNTPPSSSPHIESQLLVNNNVIANKPQIPISINFLNHKISQGR